MVERIAAWPSRQQHGSTSWAGCRFQTAAAMTEIAGMAEAVAGMVGDLQKVIPQFRI